MTIDQGAKHLNKKHQAKAIVERTQRKYILWGASIIFALVILIVVYGLLDEYVLKARKPVATVNGEKISINEFQTQVKYARWTNVQQYLSYMEIYQMLESNSPGMGDSFKGSLQQYIEQLNPSNAAVLGESILDQMIETRLINQKADELGITVTEDEIQKELQEAFGFYANGTPTPEPVKTQPVVGTSTLSPTQLALIQFTSTPTVGPTNTPLPSATPAATLESSPTPAATAEVLATTTPLPTSTPYTLEGYESEYKNYVSNLSAELQFEEEDLRKLVVNYLTSDKVKEQITADLKQEEEQLWARHILVEDETVARVLAEQLRKGENWYKMAAENSLDTSNKDAGGDLGWFGKGSMVPEFETAAYALEIGEISDPVKTEFGWHIIQLVGKEVKPLSDSAFENLKFTKFEEWIAEQKEAATIKKNDIWKDVVPIEPNIPVEALISFPAE